MNFSLRENNRSTRFREIMPKEGLLSWEDFERIKFDDQLPEVLAFRTNMDALFSLDPEKFPEIKTQIETLKNWNKRGEVNSEGAALFAFSYYYWWEKFEENGRKWETTLSEEEAAEGLMKAKEHFENHFGKELVSLGEYQKLVRGDKALPLWGLDDVITAMRSEPWKDGMRRGVQGESYIMMVRFGEGLPKIETINVFGASNRPESPHYDDQMERFLARDLKPMSLDKESVLKDAVRVYHPGEK
jgi:acyl-homoserine-lactone acylase